MLVGRADELAALRALLVAGRLVTVTGPGGVGKTTLARAVAGDADLCELARVDRGDDVAGAVARAAGFPTFDAALVGLADAERTIVLDNCEHVLDAAADVATRLTAPCPAVRVLATSREPLDVPGERVLLLGPLAVPDTDEPERLAASPAVELLLARARDLGVELPADASVAALCRRLDGLPLAIELAAARTRSLTPAEILDHLRDRLDVLARPRERGPARHRSLDATIAWSYERLPEATRVLFDRLGVFAGPFTAEQAQAVAAEPGATLLHVVGHLDLLVGQSLLTVRRHDGRTWYGLLDTLRAFARTRLAERDELGAVRDRWLDTLVATAGDVFRAMEGDEPRSWRALHTVQADLRAAARMCLNRDDGPERALVLLRPLALTVHSAPALPIAELAEAALARCGDGADASDAAAVAAFARLAVHDTGRAAALAERALAEAPGTFAAILARRTLVVCDLVGGRPDRALPWTDELLALAEAGRRSSWAIEVAAVRAVVLAALGRTVEAEDQARAARDQATALGSATLEGWAGLQYACLLALREPGAARAELEELAGRCREAAYPLGEGAAYRALGAVAVTAGDVPGAAAWLDRALDVFVRIGHTIQTRVTLRWVAALALATGRTAIAATLERVAGDVRAPVTEILDRAWLDGRLDGTGGDGRSLALAEAVALARRELTTAPSRARTGVPAPAAPSAGPAPAARFVLDGSVWTVAYAGRTVRLPHAKGLGDLAALLARPGREVHCTELAGAAVEQPGTGEVVDAEARRRYEARIVELQEQLTEAEDSGDRGRVEAASLELDLLVDQLAAARGLGGRARRGAGTAERARTAVTWRVRAAIRRIGEVHPELGEHLRRAVRTGLWCRYDPERPVEWEL